MVAMMSAVSWSWGIYGWLFELSVDMYSCLPFAVSKKIRKAERSRSKSQNI